MGDPTGPVDPKRRRFLINATSLVGGVGVVGAAVPFVASWLPSARAQAAGAPREADISKLTPGMMMTVEWRGKPVWVVRRTEEMLSTLDKTTSHLRDPDSKAPQQPEYVDKITRSIKSEYLVLVGICTHLGCSPSYRPVVGEVDPNWLGGFFCPCHGSKFDLAGRVFQGVPAPLNLEVPPYRYVNDTLILIGENPKTV